MGNKQTARVPELDAALRSAVRAVEDAREALYAVVSDARDYGYTYADIGAVLGVTRQAVYERFGKDEK